MISTDRIAEIVREVLEVDGRTLTKVLVTSGLDHVGVWVNVEGPAGRELAKHVDLPMYEILQPSVAEHCVRLRAEELRASLAADEPAAQS